MDYVRKSKTPRETLNVERKTLTKCRTVNKFHLKYSLVVHIKQKQQPWIRLQWRRASVRHIEIDRVMQLWSWNPKRKALTAKTKNILKICWRLASVTLLEKVPPNCSAGRNACKRRQIVFQVFHFTWDKLTDRRTDGRMDRHTNR